MAFTMQAITVGATKQDDSRASFSNYGSCVDIFAPGNGILTATPGSPIATKTTAGTSVSVPHVTGEDSPPPPPTPTILFVVFILLK